jgi:hypothetical protein
MKVKYWQPFVIILVVGILLGGNLLPAPVTAQDGAVDPYTLISQESLFAYLEALTTIQPHSGWRNSATEGEAEALDYVANTLDDFAYFQDLGLELERQSFHVLLSTELWDTRLYLTVKGQEVEVPADAPRGHRYDQAQALRFDSDGGINDSERNPVEVAGKIVVVRTPDRARALRAADVQGKIVFMDYEAIAPEIQNFDQSLQLLNELIEKGPSGLVLITQLFDTTAGSNGTFAGDGIVLREIRTSAVIPILFTRLEDLTPAGIADWKDLAQIETARLVWDTDVFSPGTSGNLIAHIPGVDSSRAVILGAHIDSPNSPGAMDDGSGSAILLEVARVLNEAELQPPVDLYLAWFGSEEIGLVGSQYFSSTHQDLLERTVAMLQIDCLTNTIGGSDPHIFVNTWPYAVLGNDELPLPDYLVQAVATRGVEARAEAISGITSDNDAFAGFGVPHAGVGYGSEAETFYTSRIHCPYDTVEIAQEVAEPFEHMAYVALVAALETADAADLRIAPEPDRRVLFVASHTEAPNLTPTMLIEFGMTLTWYGFDVDMVPYGQAVTTADLEDADLVIVLPVYDYPAPNAEATYDEAWSESEIDALVSYVEAGGMLVLTNSATRIQYGQVSDRNEDTLDMNDLASQFGITYARGTLTAPNARMRGEHPLAGAQPLLRLVEGNGVSFTLQNGVTLADSVGQPVAGLVDVGDAGGQVLVLADVGIFDTNGNVRFWGALAEYAR